METGLLDESIRAKIRPFLKDPNVADEVLMQQMGVAVSAEKERDKKLRGNKSRSQLHQCQIHLTRRNQNRSHHSRVILWQLLMLSNRRLKQY